MERCGSVDLSSCQGVRVSGLQPNFSPQHRHNKNSLDVDVDVDVDAMSRRRRRGRRKRKSAAARPRSGRTSARVRVRVCRSLELSGGCQACSQTSPRIIDITKLLSMSMSMSHDAPALHTTWRIQCRVVCTCNYTTEIVKIMFI